jgi:hypothetical protein
VFRIIQTPWLYSKNTKLWQHVTAAREHLSTPNPHRNQNLLVVPRTARNQLGNHIRTHVRTRNELLFDLRPPETIACEKIAFNITSYKVIISFIVLKT